MTKALTPSAARALRYVINTAGGATLAHFMEDHEPIGRLLWDELLVRGLVRQDADGTVLATEAGAAAPERPTDER